MRRTIRAPRAPAPALALALGLALALALGACGSSGKGAGSGTGGTTTTPALRGSINVLAASSLTGAFTAFAAEFEAAHPGTHVRLDFDSSAVLVAQIENGAPADVFASADRPNMAKLEAKHLVAGTPVVFARNRMEIAVGAGNPRHVATVADLARPGLAVVLCDASAPCGKYADQLLAQDHVTVHPRSREIDVKSTLAKVESGDADAALVYVTDVKAGGARVAGVPIPAAQNVEATLPIAALQGSGNAALARAWVDFVTAAPRAQALRQRFGFLAP